MISTYAFKDLMTLPQTLHLRGVCPQFGTFTINFIDEEGVNLLHLSFRLDEQRLVINENHTGDWGEQQEVADVVFPKGRPFVIRLEIAAENAIQVFLDEDLLTGFTWRTDIRKASRVDLTDVEFALFREGDTFKSSPENSKAPTTETAAPKASVEATMSEALHRLDKLIGTQKDLAACIGDIAALLAEVKQQQGEITAGMQTLLSKESTRPTGESTKQDKVA